MLQKAKRPIQETDELGLRHFAGCHGKFAMSDRSLAANISVNFHVVRTVVVGFPYTQLLIPRMLRLSFVPP
jgi:hypothetical protein